MKKIFILLFLLVPAMFAYGKQGEPRAVISPSIHGAIYHHHHDVTSDRMETLAQAYQRFLTNDISPSNYCTRYRLGTEIVSKMECERIQKDELARITSGKWNLFYQFRKAEVYKNKVVYQFMNQVSTESCVLCCEITLDLVVTPKSKRILSQDFDIYCDY